jgi:RNA polymerase sigma-70 factor (ECF subfamily)
MRPAYQAKLSVSDIVQQTMVQAIGAIETFRGQTEAEFRGWLRQILARMLTHLDRDLHRDKRDIRRECSMDQQLTQSSMRLERFLSDHTTTPSHQAMARERVLRISIAIEQLPDPQRDAVRMHYLEGLKLSEVAQRLDKSTGAVAGLLHRGMKSLRQQLAVY